MELPQIYRRFVLFDSPKLGLCLVKSWARIISDQMAICLFGRFVERQTEYCLFHGILRKIYYINTSHENPKYQNDVIMSSTKYPDKCFLAQGPASPHSPLGEPNDSTSGSSGIWTNKARPFQGGSKTHDAV